MNHEKQDNEQRGSRWLRVGLLTLTMAGPAVNTLRARLRQRAQLLQKQAKDVPTTALERLDELTLTSRQRAAEQARQLEQEGRQLRSQARRLRKALRDEALQRRNLDRTVRQLREAGVDWSQELLKRGEDLTGGLVLRGSKISHDLLERSSQAAQDLVKRGNEFGRDLTEQSSKVTHDLRKRGSEVTRDLAGRRKQLLQPVRRRNSTFWTFFGFSFGLVAAAVATYLLVRRRILGQKTEQDQSIELPQDQELNVVGRGRPSGEIHHIDNNGLRVATLQTVDVDTDSLEAPENAVFVGIVSTKYYYPLDTPLDELLMSDEELKKLVYFVSQAEAEAQGFTAAE